MLLRYGLGEEKAARRIEAAVLDTLDRGYRTGDIYSAGQVSLFDGVQFCFNHCLLFFIASGFTFLLLKRQKTEPSDH